MTSRLNNLLLAGALALTAGWIPTGDAAEKPPRPPPEAVEAAGKAMVRTHGSMYPRTRRAPAGRAVPSAPALDHPVAAGHPRCPRSIAARRPPHRRCPRSPGTLTTAPPSVLPIDRHADAAAPSGLATERHADAVSPSVLAIARPPARRPRSWARGRGHVEAVAGGGRRSIGTSDPTVPRGLAIGREVGASRASCSIAAALATVTPGGRDRSQRHPCGAGGDDSIDPEHRPSNSLRRPERSPTRPPRRSPTSRPIPNPDPRRSPTSRSIANTDSAPTAASRSLTATGPVPPSA